MDSSLRRTNAICKFSHKALQVAPTRVRTVLNWHSPREDTAVEEEIVVTPEKAAL